MRALESRPSRKQKCPSLVAILVGICVIGLSLAIGIVISRFGLYISLGRDET